MLLTFVPVYVSIHITISLTVVTTCVDHTHPQTGRTYVRLLARCCISMCNIGSCMLPCSVIFPNRVIMTLGSLHTYIGYATNTFLVVALAQRVHI